MTNLTHDQIDALIDAVREAARLDIMPRFRNLDGGDISEKTGPADLVTVADQEAEIRIAAAARQILPDAVVIGEEAVEADPALLDRLPGASRAVIIDPIDGTANFAAGLSTFGVILAVVEEGETVFGLLYDPVLDDWVMATKGDGAWFCQADGSKRRLTGPTAKPKSASMAYIGLSMFPPSRQHEVAAEIPSFQRALTLRCSCHEYRMFAFGVVDLVVAAMAKPWDHAAGMLVAAECGARIESAGSPGYDVATAKPPLVIAVAGADWVDTTDWAALFETR